jgi:uncharacterized protein
MENKPLQHSLIWSIILGLSLIGTGIIFSNAFIKARMGERIVNVKGLAEREVDADFAIWPLTFTETANDLVGLQKTIDGKRDIVTKFLVNAGFKPSEIAQSAPKIRDNQAQEYGAKSESHYRYIAQTTVLLTSENVQLVKATMEKAGGLVAQGVAIVSDWQNRTEFLFKGLNAIKPAMIEEATKNARSAAEKFAHDSGSKLGKIKNATQGLFAITDRDMNSPDKKTVRVVTVVEFYLADD